MALREMIDQDTARLTIIRKILAWGSVISASALVGCAYLPASGPGARAVTGSAVSYLNSKSRQPAYDYVMVDLTPAVISLVDDISLGSFFRTFGAKKHHAPTAKVGAGDVLQVTVFESASGGLFIPTEAGVRPGNFVTLPPQKVGTSGTISVPYAGPIRVKGKTLPRIQASIEQQLTNRAVEPQVIVSLVEQEAMPVTVVGETSKKLQLQPNERLLDVIARSGVTASSAHDLFVTLQRGRDIATVHFPTLIDNPRENIFLLPGDTVFTARKKQRFIAFGALGSAGQDSGVTGLFEFGQERISLGEAIAQAGGLVDQRANAYSVFIYRMEYRKTLERMGVDLNAFRDDNKVIPTVYRVNYRDPSVFHLAQRFPIRHKDSIYVANSESVELEKFLGHATFVSSSVSGIAGDILSTRDSVRALRN